MAEITAHLTVPAENIAFTSVPLPARWQTTPPYGYVAASEHHMLVITLDAEAYAEWLSLTDAKSGLRHESEIAIDVTVNLIPDA